MPAFAFMLCADDYALSPAVSAGILEALTAGRLTATSVMANRPSWPAAARDLAPFADRADVGLHFTLTLGAPLTKMPGFAPGGTFPQLGSIIRASILRRLPIAEIRAEIAAQIDAFAAAFGRMPAYIDGHQHVHVLPGVRSALLDELSARGLAGQIWLRDSSDALGRILGRRSEIAKALMLAGFGAGFSRAAAARGFACNDGFAGFSVFDPAGDYAVAFASYLRAPGSRHLVMCHPGHVDAELAAIDPVTQSRENELAFLLSDRFRDVCADAGARLEQWKTIALTGT